MNLGKIKMAALEAVKKPLDVLATAITTSVLICGILAAGFTQVSDLVREEMRDIATEVASDAANRVYELEHMNQAVFELNKEYGKFKDGQADSIRLSNLELVMKQSHAIREHYPELVPKLDWAIEYYRQRIIK